MADIVQRFIQAAEKNVPNPDSKRNDLDVLVQEKAKLIDEAKRLSAEQLQELRDRIWEERQEALYEEESLTEADQKNKDLEGIEIELERMIEAKKIPAAPTTTPASTLATGSTAPSVVDDIIDEKEQNQMQKMLNSFVEGGGSVIAQTVIMFKELMLQFSPPTTAAAMNAAKAQLEAIKTLYAKYVAPSEFMKMAKTAFEKAGGQLKIAKGSLDSAAYLALTREQEEKVGAELTARSQGRTPEEISVLRSSLMQEITPQKLLNLKITDYIKNHGSGTTTLEGIVKNIPPRQEDTEKPTA